jgi:redox-sensitive bicupin YhaK (pirin superfamily)
MNETRKILKIFKSKPTLEGAGVHLKRAFSHAEVPLFDPFLMLDDFNSDRPEDYIAGFPWHPHRGIETVTYMIKGRVKHGDSLGNKGLIRSGEVQWMTAGSGIIHQEMPQKQKGTLWGLQLWVNLPRSHKMMRPRYQDIKAQDIPECELESGAKIKIIAGRFQGIVGPVKEIVSDPEYLDVTVPSGTIFERDLEKGYNVLAYVLEGEGFFDQDRKQKISTEQVVLLSDGNRVSIVADKSDLRFLLISGKPIREPVAWRGPIVMNTEEELTLAFQEYWNGTFIK